MEKYEKYSKKTNSKLYSVKKKLQMEKENTIESIFTEKPKEKSTKQIFFYRKTNNDSFIKLPYNIHFQILLFLETKDICKSLQWTNKYFNTICNEPRVWKNKSKYVNFKIYDKFSKINCITERRSRGKVFSVKDRVTLEKAILREINVVVSNAGQNDGVPSSVIRELSYLSFLQHKNINKVIDYEIESEIVKIVYEYKEKNLKDFIKSQFKPQPFSDLTNKTRTKSTIYNISLISLKKITSQILNGLSYLHLSGIAHRNLKPDNILLNQNLDIFLSDFALSKFTAIPHQEYTPEDPKDRARSNREARRLFYRAPELLLRKKIYGFEIDMWTFGCLLAEIALGEPLFNGTTEIEQLFKVFRLVGSPDSSLWTRISQENYRPIFPNWTHIKFTTDFKAKNIVDKFKNREIELKKLIKLSEILGKSGMVLLEGCLQVDPSKRITAQQALKSEFFKENLEKKEEFFEFCEKKIKNYYKEWEIDCFEKSERFYTFAYIENLKKNEEKFNLPQANYMVSTQNTINEQMRAILIDWIIDVSVHFEVSSETLHLCVSFIDRYLSVKKVEKSKLQLVGVTCMKIADVFNEKSKEYYKQENSHEYAYITADEYSSTELISMEKIILSALNIQLNSPTVIHFIKAFLQLFNFEEKISLHAMFIADLLLLRYSMLEFPPSLQAFSIIFIISQLFKIPSLPNILNISIENLYNCTDNILNSWNYIKNAGTTFHCDSVFSKYRTQYELDMRSVLPPKINKKDVKNWIEN